MRVPCLVPVFLILALSPPAIAAAEPARAFAVLAANRTATMEKEMNEAAQGGLRFGAVMGGDTAAGGKEVVVVMRKADPPGPGYEYRLLATSKTSTMLKELQLAADAGYQYVGQTVFESLFGGREVVCILEREQGVRGESGYEYTLVATNRTGTLQKELLAAAGDGYELVGLTVGQTALGGAELVTILRRKR